MTSSFQKFRVGHVIDSIRPGGGPNGYLYNLDRIAKKSNDVKFDVLPFAVSEDRSAISYSSIMSRRVKFLKRLTPYQRAVYLDILFFLSSKKKKNLFSDNFIDELGKYSHLVFHNCNIGGAYITSHKPAGQKVYIMQHSPSDLALETLYDYEGLIKGHIAKGRLLHNMRTREMSIYESADGIIAPLRDSLDGYFYNDKALRERFEDLLDKKLYTVMSGIEEQQAFKTVEYRSIVNPKGRKFVVGYFGRYHEQKGYNIFLDLVKINSDNHDMQFVCAGAGSLKPHPNVYNNLIDLGWLADDIKEYMAAVDLIVSPNQSCYFDLAILEAMSLGKPVIASSVGGNHFYDAANPAVFTFKTDIVEIQKTMHSVLSKKSDAKAIKEYFYRNFSSERFLENHRVLVRQILK